jgi:outer membrane lipoprotein SlyB
VLPLFTVALTPTIGYAQPRTSNASQPRIEGFNVDEVRRLAPGVELNFSLYGSPGGSAMLRIEGARRNLALNETESGVYEGTYTIGTRDRIVARSPVTANLRVGNQVSSGVLSESLLRGVGYHASRADSNGARADSRSRPDHAALPRIERFDVQASDDLGPGNDLTFNLRGTPGAKVDMAISGTKGVFFMPEVSRGEYSGTYTIKRRDRIEANSVVTANMRVGDRTDSAILGKPLLLANAPAAPKVVRYCTNCATVEAVNRVEVNGDGNYLGTIGGGLVGAVLGSQVGGGNGRTAAQVAGALGGAYVGRNIERNAKATAHYEIVVRFANGGTQTLTYETDPGYRVGEKVKLNNGVLAHDQ